MVHCHPESFAKGCSRDIFLVLEGLILRDTFKHFLTCPIPCFFCFSVLYLNFFM